MPRHAPPHGPRDPSRRFVLKAGLSALALGALDACWRVETGPGWEPRAPRLMARPDTPIEEYQTGWSQLSLGELRDGRLYIPSGYVPETPAPLFVGLHGAGSAADAWTSFEARAEALGMVLLIPESRAWTWDIFQIGYGPDTAFINAALALVFRRCAIDPLRIAIAGFSDGASAALTLAPVNGDLFTHAIAFSPGGYDAWEDTVGQPRFWVSHGTADTVIPVAMSRDVLVPALRRAGYDVTYFEFAGPHAVPADVADVAVGWFLA